LDLDLQATNALKMPIPLCPDIVKVTNMAVIERPVFLLCLLFSFVYGLYSYDGTKREANQPPPDFEERFIALASRVEQLESRDRLQQAEIESLKVEVRAQKRRATRLELLVRNLWARKPSFPRPDQATTDQSQVRKNTDDMVNDDPTTLTGKLQLF